MTKWHEKYRREIEYCTFCPKLCRFSCPVAQIECSETVTPTGKMTVLRLVREGALPFDREVGELVYLCSGCLVSRTYCEHEIEVYPPFQAARAEAVNQGVAPESVMAYPDQWAKFGNPFQVDLAAKLKNLVPEKLVKSSAPIALFAGCTALHYFPEQVMDCVNVLSALEVDFRVVADEGACCGYPLLALGHDRPFEEQTRKMKEALAGVELILSPCPTCTHTFKDIYPEREVGLKARALHITEFLAGELGRIKIKKPETRSVIYHDPCHLGRYLGVYDQPRALLEKALGRAPLEFFESRERSTCCGGGGGLPVVKPHTARKIAGDKAAAIKDYGAELLATACPMCRRMLGRAGKNEKINATDVVSILAGAM